MKQIQVEAWHLVNLHTLRCLEQDLTLPRYDATFFDRCCAGVASTPRASAIARKDPELWHTIVIYRQERSTAACEEVPELIYMSAQKCQLREQMLVDAGVMLREHFRKRLRLYIRVHFRLGERGLDKKTKKEQNKRVNKILFDCYNAEVSDLPEVLQLRDFLSPAGTTWGDEWIPWPKRITCPNKIDFYIRLLWKIQREVEARIASGPTDKGIRTFSLFPHSASFKVAHVTINATTLFGICARIKVDTGVDMTQRWGISDVEFNHKAFKLARWTVMRKAFAVTQFESMHEDSLLTKSAFSGLNVSDKYDSASRIFANQVSSDGYSASVLVWRQKRIGDLADDARRPVKGDEPQFPPGYMPNVVIGLDPGKRSLCTSVHEDLRPQRLRSRARQVNTRQRSRKNRGRPSDSPFWIKQPKPPKTQNGLGIVSTSTREYRHMAGFNKSRAWLEGLKKRQPTFAEALRDMPSFKTGSFAAYLQRLRYVFSHLNALLAFCAERPFLKWKFFRKRMARVAVDAVAARIVPVPSNQTCVAYGNWCDNGVAKGHATCPNKGLRKALSKRAMVVSMDEFRTSMCCSTCHHVLSTVSFAVNTMLPQRKKHKGVVIARNRAEIEFKMRKCHSVLRCDNHECDAAFWDRDVNAAINILMLLKCALLGLNRPPSFSREHTIS